MKKLPSWPLALFQSLSRVKQEAQALHQPISDMGWLRKIYDIEQCSSPQPRTISGEADSWELSATTIASWQNEECAKHSIISSLATPRVGQTLEAYLSWCSLSVGITPILPQTEGHLVSVWTLLGTGSHCWEALVVTWLFLHWAKSSR